MISRIHPQEFCSQFESPEEDEAARAEYHSFLHPNPATWVAAVFRTHEMATLAELHEVNAHEAAKNGDAILAWEAVGEACEAAEYAALAYGEGERLANELPTDDPARLVAKKAVITAWYARDRAWAAAENAKAWAKSN